MAANPIIFKKNKLDLDDPNVVITVTDATATDRGQDFVDLMRNRQNTNGWATTGSNDAANTTLEFDFVDEQDLDNILIVDHNLKAYTVKFFDGAVFQDFSTPINETVNALTTTRHSFNSQSTTKIQLIITKTFVVDDDKFIAQMIATEIIAQLLTKVDIQDPVNSKERIVKRSLSGKVKVIKNVGGFQCRLFKEYVRNDADADLIAQEAMFDSHDGFLVWLSGGDTAQFNTQRVGYRLKDIFLMDCVNEYVSRWQDGRYDHGIPFDTNLVEAI